MTQTFKMFTYLLIPTILFINKKPRFVFIVALATSTCYHR